MNNAPRHPKTQIGLYQPGVWQAMKRHHVPTIEEALMAAQAVFIVDEAIARAKEQSNEPS